MINTNFAVIISNASNLWDNNIYLNNDVQEIDKDSYNEQFEEIPSELDFLSSLKLYNNKE